MPSIAVMNAADFDVVVSDMRMPGMDGPEAIRQLAARKLDGGQGTVGKLINDPAIFDAAQHLVVGVDESALLRWLVRDRQRAGIRKKYRDAQAADLPDLELARA